MNATFYNAKNLALYTPDIMQAGIAITIFVVGIFLLRWIFIVIAGMYWVHVDTTRFKNKQKTLSDLILMRDIQTELEKEIEQSTLKAAFQN